MVEVGLHRKAARIQINSILTIVLEDMVAVQNYLEKAEVRNYSMRVAENLLQ